MGPWHVNDYGSLSNVVNWTMFAATFVVVCFRILCRTYRGAGVLGYLGLDDFITIVCVIILLASSILSTIGASYGLGRHAETLTADQRKQALMWNVVINAVTVWSFSMPKFAIIAVLKRILNYGRKTAILFWTLALSCQAQTIAISIWWFKQCSPVEYQWDKSIEGSCSPVSVISNWGYFFSAQSAVLDLFLAIYPIPFIMRLNLPLRSRIAVSCSLSLSMLGFIVSVYKLVILGSVFEMMPSDPTYPGPFLVVLGNAEGTILIICASLPTLGPLFRLAKTSIKSKTSMSTEPRNESQVGCPDWQNIKGNKIEDSYALTSISPREQDPWEASTEPNVGVAH